MTSQTTTTTATAYRCPTHPDERLRNVLAGGAGYCARCHQFVQAAGVEPPQLDEWVRRRRAAGTARPTRRKKRAAQKAA